MTLVKNVDLFCLEITCLNTFSYLNDALFEQITETLTTRGYCVLTDFLNPELTASLQRRVMNLDDDDFKHAGIGREHGFQVENTIRTDETRWLSDQHPVDAMFLQYMSEFKLALNRHLFLGLFDYECHYAHYAPGAFYKKHLDAFKGEANRVLSTVMYFNKDWQQDDGGQLLIYHPESGDVIESINPEYGTFVVFMSEEFPHQVVKSKRDRYSITGWFRIDRPLLR
ncbi:MAG: 2OG-Fe(II) oxygenase [Gammaproteobacteria bacterium]|nr:2OG-Fe(II) oxygenase [Gammaproteobacteria bacterium]